MDGVRQGSSTRLSAPLAACTWSMGLGGEGAVGWLAPTLAALLLGCTTLGCGVEGGGLVPTTTPADALSSPRDASGEQRRDLAAPLPDALPADGALDVSAATSDGSSERDGAIGDGPVARADTAVASDVAPPIDTAPPVMTTMIFQERVSPTPLYSGGNDSTLIEEFPNMNYSGSTRLRADGDSPSGLDLAMLLRWNISAILTRAKVVAAKIVLTPIESSEGVYEMYEVKRAWKLTEVTWKEASAGMAWGAPGAQAASDRGEAVLGVVGPAGEAPLTVELNSAGIATVQSWVRTPASNNGIVVANAKTPSSLVVYSNNAAAPAVRPQLIVTYTLD